MTRVVLLALLPAALAGPVAAQTPDPHAGHSMPGQQPADPHAGHGAPSKPPAPAADPHAGHAMPPPAEAPTQTGADLPVGSEPPPAPPSEAAADRVHGVAGMDRARDILRQEHGGVRVSKLMLNEAEVTPGSSRAYRWDGEAWFGGDLNRVVVKSEGEGARHGGVEDAEVQLLYSRAVGVYTDLQAGVRHDFEPGPARTYATVGFETLLPYWFEAEGALFLSEKGDLLARLEGSYDFRLAQRVVLQPRAEFNFAAQDEVRRGVGSGLSDAELGLRLRYEIRREFAPYVGVVWTRKVGSTADFARAEGEDVKDLRAVVGVRTWF